MNAQKGAPVVLIWTCADCGMVHERPLLGEPRDLPEIKLYPIYHEVMRLHTEAMQEDGQAPHWRIDIRSCRVSLDYPEGSELCSGKVEVGFRHA